MKRLKLGKLPNPFEEINIYNIAISKTMFPNNIFEEMKNSSQNDYLLEEEFGIENLSRYREVLGFIEGYKAAQSKKYSLEDMKKAIEMAREGKLSFKFDNEGIVYKHTPEQIIQSLSTQQLPVSFEPEYINTNSFGSETNGYDSGNFILKTITNSKGKEELVGTYKY